MSDLELRAIVTDAGLAAASRASPTGPWINLVKFKVGTAYNYGGPTDPQQIRYDTGLRGTVLYEAPISGYENVPPKTLNVRCVIPPEIGPFEFGEVGLYLPDDVLFCKLVFPSLQLKTSTLITNVATRYTINCLINLEQSTAIFQVNSGAPSPNKIWVVDRWSDVLPADEMANAGYEMVIVKELDSKGRSSILADSNGQKWTIGSTYEYAFQGTVVNSTSNSITLAASDASNANVQTIGQVNRSFVIEDANGYFRSVASVTNSGANQIYNINPNAYNMIPAIGSTVTVYRNNMLGLPEMTSSWNGIGRPGNGIISEPDGVFATYGLLHGVPGAGRVLTSADNINNTNLPSGEYAVSSGSLPLGLPPDINRNCRVRISNYNGFIAQEVFPQNTSGDSSNNPHTSSWWRSWSSGTWGPWRTAGLGGGNLQFIGNFGAGATASGVFTEAGAIMAFNNGSDPAIAGYLNGNMVTAGDADGGSEGITIVGYKGSSWACVAYRRTMTVYRVLLG